MSPPTAALAFLISGVGVAQAAESLCGDAVPEPGSGPFFAAFTTDADGHSDGSVGIHLPDAPAEMDLAYVVIARVHFEDISVTWSTPPMEADADGYVEWFADVPDDALVADDQHDYLSSLDIRVDVYIDGVFEARVAVPSARVAFERDRSPLVLLADEAEELAPHGVWNPEVEPREGAIDAALVPRPPVPDDLPDGPNQEDAQ